MLRHTLTLLLIALAARAQVQELPETSSAAAVHEALTRLSTTGSVLHVTAHPDDEDAALLAWLSRGRGLRVGLLSLTRGEGGANLLGPEMYDALGLLRTEELLAATRRYGAELFFTRAADFGFSKRLDETLEQWDRQAILRDAVQVVRRFRPDVIVARFHGAARDGHGNHQTAGLMARDAFAAAGDPSKFPDAGPAWKVKKLYLSVRESEPSTLKIDTGEHNPLLGRSYRELGREGYGMHRSQGVGLARAPKGASYSALRLVEGANAGQPETDPLAGVLTALTDLRGAEGLSPDAAARLAEIAASLASARTEFDARVPDRIVLRLAAALKQVRALLTGAPPQSHATFLLRVKERQLTDAIHKALAVSVEALVEPKSADPAVPAFFRMRESFRAATPGQAFGVTVTTVNRSSHTLTRLRVTLPHSAPQPPANSAAQTLAPHASANAQLRVTLPEDAPLTRPDFTRQDAFREHAYRVRDDWPQRPFPAPALSATVAYEVAGVEIDLTSPVQTVFIDRLDGEQRQILQVLPAVGVSLSPRRGVLPNGATKTAVRVELSHQASQPSRGTLRLTLPQGATATPASLPFTLTGEGEKQGHDFVVTLPPVTSGRPIQIGAVAEVGGRTYEEGVHAIAYRDLEPRTLYAPASMELRGVDVTVTPGVRVGYVMGVGDEVPQSLRQVGVETQSLTAQDLATADLDRFDTILVGIRASAVRPDWKAYHRRLLDFVERGGHLVVQYQTYEFDDAPYGPFPHTVTRGAEEVSEESAAVTLLVPDHQVFQMPNRITPADFDGWVEERGSKFMRDWDSRYVPLLESHDREQPPQRGGLLTARHGKGTYTYCAYAFYRQLPAAVPGAYRLFANLLRKADR